MDKNKMKWVTSTIFTFAVVAMVPAQGPAQTIVDWGGDYVTSEQPSQRGNLGISHQTVNTADNTTDAIRGGISFHSGLALNPTIGANYSGSSDRFFGGTVAPRKNGGGNFGVETRLFVADGGANDYMDIRATRNEPSFGDGHLWTSYVLWDKADFLGGADSATLSFDGSGDLGLDSISATMGDVAGDGNWNTLRWYVESGGTKYISEDVTGAGTIVDNTTYSTADFSMLMWEQSQVSDGSVERMFVDSGTFAVDSSTLTDITAIGLVVQSLGEAGPPTGSDALRRWQLSSFQVEASPTAVVPEPSTIAIWSLLSIVGVGFTLRRGKRVIR